MPLYFDEAKKNSHYLSHSKTKPVDHHSYGCLCYFSEDPLPPRAQTTDDTQLRARSCQFESFPFEPEAWACCDL